MEYTKEMILKLAEDLERCADPKRSCAGCTFDKTCDRGDENGGAIFQAAATVIRSLMEERDAFFSLITKTKFPELRYGVTREANEARLEKCNDQEAEDNPSVSCADSSLSTREPLKGQAWQMGLYERTIKRYGQIKQVTKAVEELGELAVELSRWLLADGIGDGHLLSHIKEELADVCIMTDQLQLIFGDVSDWEMHKLERLERRLERGL
jgi:hypothetical protein